MTISVDSRDVPAGDHTFISPHEAIFLASKLHPLPPSDYGNADWIEQHQALESLSLQAHADARCQRDECVKAALVAGQGAAMSALVVDLLVSEAWTQRAFPLLKDHIARHLDSVLGFTLVQRESAVAALLQVALHHPDAAHALSDDAQLELCDWCARKLAYLDRGNGRKFAQRAGMWWSIF